MSTVRSVFGEREVYEEIEDDSIMADITKIPIIKNVGSIGGEYSDDGFNYAEKSEFEGSRMGGSEFPI